MAGGPNPSPETYTITTPTDLTGITGFRLEVLPDPSLAEGGPGRAVNGNFSLNEFRVMASPRAGPGKALPVKLRNPVADYSQEGYGGWPIAAALDGDLKTGWSIDPQEGRPHLAVFQAEKPIGFPGGTLLEFVLQQGFPEGHNLGRLRLSATTASPPFPVPRSVARSVIVQGKVPPSAHGGLLAVTVQLTHGATDAIPRSRQSHDRARNPERPGGCVAAHPRHRHLSLLLAGLCLPIASSSRPQAFELAIATNLGPGVHMAWKAHYIPRY